jgi:hypothetical protein
VACRRRPPESVLGSLYRITAGSDGLTATESEILFRAPYDGWFVTTIEESGVRATIESVPDACRIIPPPSAASTLRWKYRVGLGDGKRLEASL